MSSALAFTFGVAAFALAAFESDPLFVTDLADESAMIFSAGCWTCAKLLPCRATKIMAARNMTAGVLLLSIKYLDIFIELNLSIPFVCAGDCGVESSG